jgi:hypothetical protein
VTTERGLVCIPDRDTAECELTRLKHQDGPNLIKAVIRKDRPGGSGNIKNVHPPLLHPRNENRPLF